MILTLSLFAALTLAMSPAVAADPPPQAEVRLQAWLVQTVVEQARVQERLQPLKDVRPGDVVEYEARYINTTARPVSNVQLTLPVPAGGLELTSLDTLPSRARWASLDGRRFDPIPLKREVRRADGHVAVEPVPLSEYRYLRWQLGDLPAGAERTVRARMQLPPLVGVGRP
ncbi:hypothetical protein CDN99_07175 [Roseateles aquatilis]|uniref:DUF11 domain-containing protein n=1 Tax=Roseateles aquatilis TaxID=431061 RepID=A0A246JHL2_9BURK|nr:hypothetical protein CDN99_07175 [Roseateles aquatilis]